MNPMTKKKIQESEFKRKVGKVGPLFWRYHKGYGNAPILLYSLPQLNRAPIGKFCGPVYLDRPVRKK